MIKNKLFIFLMVMIFIASTSPILMSRSKSVTDSKHNLSVTGKGDIKSISETRVCIFCHSSHNASKEGPLWNHSTPSSSKFVTYERSTLAATAEQPNGATKLCLSCHDGTIAVGALLNRPHQVPMKNVSSQGTIPSNKKSNLGFDLSGAHPVSIKYNQNSALASDHLRWPPFDVENKVGPDKNGYVQCTACHDPHDSSKSEKYPFWKKATFSEVCDACHKY